jgi:hypothetical protein
MFAIVVFYTLCGIIFRHLSLQIAFSFFQSEVLSSSQANVLVGRSYILFQSQQNLARLNTNELYCNDSSIINMGENKSLSSPLLGQQ